jgi:peptidoglycan/LPS O-acetylase OafA/YrhL
VGARRVDETRALPLRVPPRRPAGATTPTGLRHVPALDGLRAVAVVAVLAYHADLSLAAGGFLGVEAFFTLSGFLVTGLVLAEFRDRGRVDLPAFYRARGRRLVPALVVCVLGTLLLFTTVLGPAVPDLRADAIAALSYVQNWHLVFGHVPYGEAFDRPSPMLHLWSLAVEGQLYLLWPVLLVALLRAVGPRAGVIPVLALAALSTWAMAVLYDPDDISRVYYGTDTRAAGFLIGAALAMLVVRRPGHPPGRRTTDHALDLLGGAALVTLVVGLIATSEFADGLYRHGGFARTALLTALVMAAATRTRSHVGALLARGPLVWLGQRSYGIYLYHWPIFVLTRPDIDVPGPAWIVDMVRVTATLVVAELSYRLVELPVRRGALRRWSEAMRHGPRRSPAAGLAVSALLVGTLTLSCGPLVVVPGAAAPVPVTVPPAPVAATPSPTAGPPTTVAPPAVAPATTAATTALPGPTGAPVPTGAAALVVGDSVVLGSAGALEAALGSATTVDGKVGRQFDRGPAIVAAWVASNPGPVVVHLGSNGIIRDDDVEAMVAATRGRALVFVNVAVPRRWQEPDNAELAAAAARHPGQVRIVDWASIVAADPALLGPDRVHPNQRGREALAAAVRAALG